MRAEIINHLKANVPLVGGQVYQAYMAPKNMKSPYLVVKSSGEVRNFSHMHAFDAYIEIWPYMKPESFVSIDSITTQVIAAMSKPINTPAGEIALTYRGSGEDFYDDEYKQITNGPLEFEVHTIKELRR